MVGHKQLNNVIITLNSNDHEARQKIRKLVNQLNTKPYTHTLALEIKGDVSSTISTFESELQNLCYITQLKINNVLTSDFLTKTLYRNLVAFNEKIIITDSKTIWEKIWLNRFKRGTTIAIALNAYATFELDSLLTFIRKRESLYKLVGYPSELVFVRQNSHEDRYISSMCAKMLYHYQTLYEFPVRIKGLTRDDLNRLRHVSINPVTHEKHISHRAITNEEVIQREGISRDLILYAMPDDSPINVSRQAINHQQNNEPTDKSSNIVDLVSRITNKTSGTLHRDPLTNKLMAGEFIPSQQAALLASWISYINQVEHKIKPSFLDEKIQNTNVKPISEIPLDELKILLKQYLKGINEGQLDKSYKLIQAKLDVIVILKRILKLTLGYDLKNKQLACILNNVLVDGNTFSEISEEHNNAYLDGFIAVFYCLFSCRVFVTSLSREEACKNHDLLKPFYAESGVLSAVFDNEIRESSVGIYHLDLSRLGLASYTHRQHFYDQTFLILKNADIVLLDSCNVQVPINRNIVARNDLPSEQITSCIIDYICNKNSLMTVNGLFDYVGSVDSDYRDAFVAYVKRNQNEDGLYNDVRAWISAAHIAGCMVEGEHYLVESSGSEIFSIQIISNPLTAKCSELSLDPVVNHFLVEFVKRKHSPLLKQYHANVKCIGDTISINQIITNFAKRGNIIAFTDASTQKSESELLKQAYEFSIYNYQNKMPHKKKPTSVVITEECADRVAHYDAILSSIQTALMKNKAIFIVCNTSEFACDLTSHLQKKYDHKSVYCLNSNTVSNQNFNQLLKENQIIISTLPHLSWFLSSKFSNIGKNVNIRIIETYIMPKRFTDNIRRHLSKIGNISVSMIINKNDIRSICHTVDCDNKLDMETNEGFVYRIRDEISRYQYIKSRISSITNTIYERYLLNYLKFKSHISSLAGYIDHFWGHFRITLNGALVKLKKTTDSLLAVSNVLYSKINAYAISKWPIFLSNFRKGTLLADYYLEMPTVGPILPRGEYEFSRRKININGLNSSGIYADITQTRDVDIKKSALKQSLFCLYNRDMRYIANITLSISEIKDILSDNNKYDIYLKTFCKKTLTNILNNLCDVRSNDIKNELFESIKNYGSQTDKQSIFEICSKFIQEHHHNSDFCKLLLMDMKCYGIWGELTENERFKVILGRDLSSIKNYLSDFNKLELNRYQSSWYPISKDRITVIRTLSSALNSFNENSSLIELLKNINNCLLSIDQTDFIHHKSTDSFFKSRNYFGSRLKTTLQSMHSKLFMCMMISDKNLEVLNIQRKFINAMSDEIISMARLPGISCHYLISNFLFVQLDDSQLNSIEYINEIYTELSKRLKSEQLALYPALKSFSHMLDSILYHIQCYYIYSRSNDFNKAFNFKRSSC